MRYYTMYLAQQVSMMGALVTVLFAIWHALRDKRKQVGLSIESAAEGCGVDPSTYARWERLKQNPHPKNLKVLMEKINPYDEICFSKCPEWTYPPDAWLPPSYWLD